KGGGSLREDADVDAVGIQAAQDAARVGVRTQIDRRSFFGEPLEQPFPIGQLGLERADVDAKAVRRVRVPILHQFARVAERVQVDGDGLHARTRSHASNPSMMPAASIAKSTGDECRPATKCWCSWSLA